MGVVVHGLCYTVEFSVVFLTFILSFDFLFQFYEGHLLVEALINIPSLYHLQWVNEANAGIPMTAETESFKIRKVNGIYTR